jgi:hypothetical protein
MNGNFGRVPDMKKKSKCYERSLIQINPHTVVLLQLFHSSNHIVDACWLSDCSMHLREDLKTHKHAAKQFVDQLEDHWTALFMMALRDAINNELKKNDKKYGTKFHREYKKEKNENNS